MPTPPQPLLVSAASSLTDALPRIAQAFVGKYPAQPLPHFNFAASGVLVKQMEAGAPVDVFVSASLVEVGELQKKGLLAGPPVWFAGNRLVLVVPAGQNGQAAGTVKTWDDLRGTTVKHLALSNPETVPSGRIAREVLQNRHLWAAVQPKLVRGENVRQTLAYAARGDVDAAIVFYTDALSERRVRIIAEARAGRGGDYLQAIVYPVCVLARSPRKNAAHSFAAFLREPPAQAVLRELGFTPAPPK